MNSSRFRILGVIAASFLTASCAANARRTAEWSCDGLMPKLTASQEYDHGRWPKATSLSITKMSWGLSIVIIRTFVLDSRIQNTSNEFHVNTNLVIYMGCL